MMVMITSMLMSTMISKHVDHDVFEEGLPLLIDDYDHEDDDHVVHHDDGKSVPEVAADEDDDASEKCKQGGVVDSVGLHPEEICNEHRGFKR